MQWIHEYKGLNLYDFCQSCPYHTCQPSHTIKAAQVNMLYLKVERIYGFSWSGSPNNTILSYWYDRIYNLKKKTSNLDLYLSRKRCQKSTLLEILWSMLPNIVNLIWEDKMLDFSLPLQVWYSYIFSFCTKPCMMCSYWWAAFMLEITAGIK